MPLLDLDKISAGLSTTWVGYLRDWDRTLRSASYPETTRWVSSVRAFLDRERVRRRGALAELAEVQNELGLTE
jgi:hypothetical protein